MGALGLVGFLCLVSRSWPWNHPRPRSCPWPSSPEPPAFILIVTLVYIEFFLTQFVVPIMYRHRLSATEAWRRFLPVFREHPGGFVLFGLFYFVIMLVGWILLMVGRTADLLHRADPAGHPLHRTVVTLPLHTLTRYFSLEYPGAVRGRIPVAGAAAGPDPGHPYGIRRGPG